MYDCMYPLEEGGDDIWTPKGGGMTLKPGRDSSLAKIAEMDYASLHASLPYLFLFTILQSDPCDLSFAVDLFVFD
jgi:hypothetical protein